jgi:pimeloyl-ACP methyl ester carboxylesterase
MNRMLWRRGTLHIENNAIRPAPNERRSPNGSTRIYLLVHGFNNDRVTVQASYSAFKKRVRDIIGSHLAQRIWEFYWPCYEDAIAEPLRQRWKVFESANSAYTAACYFKQIPKAQAFGKMLGDYLLRLRAATQATEVVLIGHFLGCRLILEALLQMEPNTTSSKVPAILLMAAAVPVEHLKLAGYLRAAVHFPQHRIVLYSSRDTVLRWTFPAGQLLARDGGLRPGASGLNGDPRDCWTSKDQTMLRHGQYWSNDATTPNIVRLFGKTTPHALPYFEIVSRTLPEPPHCPSGRPRRTSPRNPKGDPFGFQLSCHRLHTVFETGRDVKPAAGRARFVTQSVMEH